MATHPLTDEQLGLLGSAGGGALLRPVRRVIRALNRRDGDAVIIGGAVRDILLGRSPGDLDLATSATPDQVLEVAEEEGWLPIPVGKAFGVVRVRLSGVEFEVATFRSEETYPDGRRPDPRGVEFRGTLEEDVSRRDFTMNGLALRLLDDEPAVVDLVGGVTDIRDRTIRTIGDAVERFEEDALRPLRAVRFAAVLGFDIDAATEEAMAACAAGLRRVSGERIQQELGKAFGDGDPQAAAARMINAGFFPHLFPDLGPEQPAPHLIHELLARIPGSPGLPVFLAVLSMASGTGRPDGPSALRCEGLAGRVKLSRADTGAAVDALLEAAGLLAAGSMSLPRRADLYRSRHYNDAMALARAAAGAAGDDMEPLAVLDRERAALPEPRLHPPTLVTGDDLIDLGLKMGPRIGQLLRAVQDAQVTGEINTREEALAWLQEEISGV